MTLRNSLSLLAVCLILITGCVASTTTDRSQNSLDAKSTTQDAPAIAQSDKDASARDGMHCTHYRPTGSHRKITRCITKEQQQLERDAARRTLGNSQGPAVSPPSDI